MVEAACRWYFDAQTNNNSPRIHRAQHPDTSELATRLPRIVPSIVQHDEFGRGQVVELFNFQADDISAAVEVQEMLSGEKG
jgi:hypothetical protein